jgi:hypothetical protein
LAPVVGKQLVKSLKIARESAGGQAAKSRVGDKLIFVTNARQGGFGGTDVGQFGVRLRQGKVIDFRLLRESRYDRSAHQ